MQSALKDLEGMGPPDPGPDGLLKAVTAGGRVIAVLQAGENGAAGRGRALKIARIFSHAT